MELGEHSGWEPHGTAVGRQVSLSMTLLWLFPAYFRSKEHHETVVPC